MLQALAIFPQIPFAVLEVEPIPMHYTNIEIICNMFLCNCRFTLCAWWISLSFDRSENS